MNNTTTAKKEKKTKKELINKHKSQIESLDYSNKIIELNSYRALQVFKNCIEAYMKVEIKTLKQMVKWVKPLKLFNGFYLVFIQK